MEVVHMTILSKTDLGVNNLRDFGSNFHWARAEKGLSLTDVAKLTNYDEKTLEQIEIGFTDLDMDIIIRLIKFYDLKLILRIEGRDD